MVEANKMLMMNAVVVAEAAAVVVVEEADRTLKTNDAEQEEVEADSKSMIGIVVEADRLQSSHKQRLSCTLHRLHMIHILHSRFLHMHFRNQTLLHSTDHTYY